ncbi:MAG: septum formation initiator family protein [Pseudomonadaceae bacterium]|nr:septum formation initiator family protein [Pseudomonadaceae bacterium]
MKNPRRRLLQMIVPLLVVLLLAYTANQLVGGEKGIFTWRLLRDQVAMLEQQNAQLQAEVARLNKQVERLKKPVDADFMDEMVRKTLPLAKPGEEIILISPSG